MKAMIVTPFFTELLVKDFDMDESWTNELITTLKVLTMNKDNNCTLAQSLEDKTIAGLFKYDKQKSTKPYIIHEESASQHQVIKDLRNIFLDGFLELNKSYGNQYTKSEIKDKFVKDSGNFAVLENGMHVGAHNHPSIAFAIFYLSDVDNEHDGGELILHDPSFHRNTHFHDKKEMSISTKKNRLVVGPAHVWHEVTPYLGKDPRMCAVIDLGR
jgi:hypothetical protein